MHKVVILAAGQGSRLGNLTKNFHKALLPIGTSAVISHILAKFSNAPEIIVAVGYEHKKLEDYLRLAHPERSFRFVKIDNFSGPRAGPGYSLLQCKKWLQGPFIITTVDTLVEEDLPAPTTNWIGVAAIEPQEAVNFNSVKLNSGLVKAMRDKEASDFSLAFIGLAGIKDYKVFWRALSADQSLIRGERQLSSGLMALLAHRLAGVEFTWFDTGSKAQLVLARQQYSGGKAAGDYDFTKSQEYLYLVGKRVVKYFADSTIAKHRVERAGRLAGIVPTIVEHADHFYAYEKVPGTTAYQLLHRGLFLELLAWLEKNLWQPADTRHFDQSTFRRASWKFYHDKTLERVAKYFEVTGEPDRELIINGERVATLQSLLERVPWQSLCDGIASIFHGDLQFDNILVTGNKKQPFVLIDWRQDFAGLLELGDRYYDLAKLYGGMIIPYHLVKQNLISFEQAGKKVRFDLHQTYVLSDARAVYADFIKAKGYDWNRVRLLTALIFLNMAALHEPPFRQLLRALGSLELQRILDDSDQSAVKNRTVRNKAKVRR